MHKSLKVSLTSVKNYNEISIKKSLQKSLDLLGGVQRFVKKGSKVLVKPNMFQGFSPSRGVTTHPAIIKAVIKMVQELGATVIVGDNPACLKSGSSKEYLSIAEITGIKRVVEESASSLIYLDKSIKNLEVDDILINEELSKVALEADVIINVPKLKGHGLMGISGGIKNVFGIVPGLRKLDYHARFQSRKEFANVLVSLYQFIKPSLTIMDAIEIVDGEGSIVRQPKFIGAIITSESSLAADIVGSKLLRIDPLSIPVISIALAKGLEISSIEDIVIVGDGFSKFKIPQLEFPTSVGKCSLSSHESKRLYKLVPKINGKKCQLCGTCVMICPGKAIRVMDEKLIVLSKNCIKCFCCVEACKFGAISAEVRKSEIN